MDSDVRKSVSNTDALLVCMLRCKGQPNSPRFPHPDKTVGLGGIPARYPRGILAGGGCIPEKVLITGPLKVPNFSKCKKWSNFSVAYFDFNN